MSAADPSSMLIHGTCIACGGRAVLLRGASGSGKSDLAFRLLSEEGDGAAALVADDQVIMRREGDRLLASPPAALAGLLELRGLGLLSVTYQADVPVVLLVDLVARSAVPRLPEPIFEVLMGVTLPRLALHAFDMSAPAKLRLAMQSFPDAGFPGDDGRILRV